MGKSSKKYILSDSSVNEYGFRMLTLGYQMSEFQKNPIGYYMHKREDGVALRWEDMAIEGDNVVGYPVVNLNNPRGAQIENEVEEGFLNAASMGHIVVLEHSMDPKLMLKGQTGPTITKWYAKECSLVDIPGNRNALTNLFDQDGNAIKLADLMGGTTHIKKLNSPNNMEGIVLTQAAQEALALSAGADGTAINMAVVALAAKNSELQLKLDQQIQTGKKEKVNDLLSKALADKKITKEFQTVLASDYAESPEKLEVVLKAMPAFQSVNTKLKESEVSRDGEQPRTPEVVALMAKGWDKLHKEGGLADLRDKCPEAYNELYKGKYGYEPNQKPVPKK